MARFETKFERLEFKYLIDERKADQVRRQLEPYCRPDRYNVEAPGEGVLPGYLVSSLYLDSPGLAFHEAKQRGDSDRLKLRVRTYSDSTSAVLELKRRVSDVVEKTRARVDSDRVEEIALGRVMPLDMEPEARLFLNGFARIVAQYGACPTLHLSYRREAYSSAVDQYARVTFDRQIASQRTGQWSLEPDPQRWCFFDDWWRPEYLGRPVLLELKCHARMPGWMIELVRRNNLERRSFSKYSVGIYITGRLMGQDLMPRRSARTMR